MTLSVGPAGFAGSGSNSKPGRADKDAEQGSFGRFLEPNDPAPKATGPEPGFQSGRPNTASSQAALTRGLAVAGRHAAAKAAVLELGFRSVRPQAASHESAVAEASLNSELSMFSTGVANGSKSSAGIPVAAADEAVAHGTARDGAALWKAERKPTGTHSKAGGDEQASSEAVPPGLSIATPLIEIIAAGRLSSEGSIGEGGDERAETADALDGQAPRQDVHTGDGAAAPNRSSATGPGNNRRAGIAAGLPALGESPVPSAPADQQDAAEQAGASRTAALDSERAPAGRGSNGEAMRPLPAGSPRGIPSATGFEHGPAYRVLATDMAEASERPSRSRLEAYLSASRAAPSGPAFELQNGEAARNDAEALGPVAELARTGRSPFEVSSGLAPAAGSVEAVIAEPVALASRRRVPTDYSAALRSGGQARSIDGAERPLPLTVNGSTAVPGFLPWGQPSDTTISALVQDLASHPLLGAAAAGTPAAAPASAHAIKLELHPAELGMVTVSLKMVGEQLRIELNVENQEAHSRLSADADSIVRAMQSLGFEVDQVTINQSAVASSPGQGQAAAQAGSQSRDQQPLFSGQSGQGGERTPREGRNGNQGGGQAPTHTHHSGARGSDLYI